ncbi:hypothetical protein Clacol_007520 [Clathrus columnatus]|uniref:Uncharacterized protein n=1 Tax=Clathrus columnatus TaxID=1419009 RepID=A0AAV5AKP6_9AGAM|nr:hypothetical protein Clacol_007520 [Clathrus columnatus]
MDENLPRKRAPSVQEWDGIVIRPPILQRAKSRLRPGPETPIRDASEFQSNSLAGDLAAQRLQSNKNEREEKDRKVEVSGGGVEVKGKSGDMGFIRRKQDRKTQRNSEGVGAAMQSFQSFRHGSSQETRPSKPDSKKGRERRPAPTTTQNTQNTKVSRRRVAKTVYSDGEESAVQNVSFSDSRLSPQTDNNATIDVFDGDNFAVETPLRLKGSDPVTAPKKEALPGPLAILNSQIFYDVDVDSQVEEFVGDYDAHFSAQNWEYAHKEGTGKTLPSLEYASLTVSHNVTLNAAKKRRSLQTINRFLQRVT